MAMPDQNRHEGLTTRDALPSDLAAIDRIQSLSPEAVRWEPESYLSYHCRVALAEGNVAGFIAVRRVAEQEFEVLNMAVDPSCRRRGIGERLLAEAFARSPGTWFLEVRDSNQAALNLYRRFGFQEIGRRPKYYQDTAEAAVVMRIQK